MGKAIEFIVSEPWAITQEALDQIIVIADRAATEDIEAIAARVGRPLVNTRNVEVRDNGIALIPITGPIFPRANLFTEISGATSIEILAKDFVAAQENPAVTDTVLWIESPGGVIGGISEFAQIVSAATKPVIAYVGEQAQSAGYWIAAAADEIVVGDTSLLGGLGVVLGINKKDDGRIEFISSQSPGKRPNPETETGRQQLQALTDDLADVFIDAVAEYRKVSRETVLNDFGQGASFVGAKAITAGLADRLGSLESTIAGISGSTHRGNPMSANEGTPAITRAELAEKHPAIVEDIKTEGYGLGHADGLKEGSQAGATAERDRIQAVLDQSMPGHEAMVRKLAFDGKTTGPEAAVAVLAAEKQGRAKAREDLQSEAPKPLAPVASLEDAGGVDPNLPVQERCKATWERDPKIRAEFGSLESYTAYVKAEESGRVRRIGGKS